MNREDASFASCLLFEGIAMTLALKVGLEPGLPLLRDPGAVYRDSVDVPCPCLRYESPESALEAVLAESGRGSGCSLLVPTWQGAPMAARAPSNHRSKEGTAGQK